MRLLPTLMLMMLVMMNAAALAQEGEGKRRSPAQADVRDFGAVGDGVADDTAPLQKAVDSGMGIVRLNRGVYRITKPIVIELDKTGFVAIEGHGVGRIVMAGEGPALKFVGTHTKGSADPNSFQPNVWEKQRMPMVDGVEIIGAHENADAIQADGTMQLTVTRTRISQCRHGIHLVNRNRNITVSDSHIYHNRGIGIFYDNLSLHQSNIIGTHISYCGGGGIVFRGGDVRNVHIGTCDIESNHDPKGAPTANVLIDCSGSYNGTAEVAITGCTIQHNSKSPESANIRILGRGDADPETAKTRRPPQQWGHVTIVGNVLSDVMTNIHLKGARDVTVTGNTFWMGFTHNLLVEDCSDIVITGNAMDRNPAYAYGNTAAANNPVVFRDSRDVIFSANQVKGVHRSPAGVVLENCDRFNLTGNSILDCDNAGILARNLTRSRISGSIIRDDREGKSTPAMQIEGGSGNQIVDNLTND